jgi:hypothetical protein
MTHYVQKVAREVAMEVAMEDLGIEVKSHNAKRRALIDAASDGD